MYSFMRMFSFIKITEICCILTKFSDVENLLFWEVMSDLRSHNVKRDERERVDNQVAKILLKLSLSSINYKERLLLFVGGLGGISWNDH